MPEKLTPTSKQKSTLVMHVLVFIIANAAMWAYWYFGQGANNHWVYPWAIWITAAWGLSLIGHTAAVYTSYEDAGNADFIKQRDN